MRSWVLRNDGLGKAFVSMLKRVRSETLAFEARSTRSHPLSSLNFSILVLGTGESYIMCRGAVNPLSEISEIYLTRSGTLPYYAPHR